MAPAAALDAYWPGPGFETTRHARRRMAQRNLSASDVAFALQYGQIFHRAGAILCHLRRQDIPGLLRAEARYAQLEGTTVVLSREDASVLTVYRNRRCGLKRIKQKPRHSWKERN